MRLTDEHTLQNIDPEDIGDVIMHIERSFGLRFRKDAFLEVKTFGDVCDVIYSAVQAGHEEGCTSQQAFYKLRSAIAGLLQTDERQIVPATGMEELFPRKGRRKKMRQLQAAVSSRLDILEIKEWVGFALLLSYLTSIIGLFIRWRLGLAGFLFSLAASDVAGWFANELSYQNVGDVALLFMRMNYKNARRNSQTVNRNEIVPVVKEIFRHDLQLEPEVLTREAPVF